MTLSGTNKCHISVSRKKKENMEEDAKDHNLGWLFSLRMKSWKERMGKERMGKWVIGGKVGCPVPHWGPEGSVATAPCQNITSSVLWDTWLFTPEHARWLPQLSDPCITCLERQQGSLSFNNMQCIGVLMTHVKGITTPPPPVQLYDALFPF